MPVGWAAGAMALGSIAGAALQGDAAKDAARTQRAGAADASAVQREMFNTVNAQQQPFMQAAYGANAELSRLLGIVPQTAMGNAPGTEESTAWDQSSGRLIGDTYLPADTRLVSTDGGKDRYYDVFLGDVKIGDVRPGGSNGRFRHSGAPIPTPAQLARAQPGGAGGQSPGSMWRPTASGGVTAAIGLGPGGSGAPVDAGGVPTSGGTGLPTGYLSQTFGPQQFLQGMDPGYQWRLQQGAQGVMNGASAASGSLSGPALKALMEYNQGAASQEFGSAFDRFQTQQGNIFQRLSSIANTGQNAAAGVGAQGVATAGNIGSNIVGAANAGAAGQIGAANAYGGALSDLGALGGWYAMNRQGGG